MVKFYCEECGERIRKHKASLPHFVLHKQCFKKTIRPKYPKYDCHTGRLNEWWAEVILRKRKKLIPLKKKMKKCFEEGDDYEAVSICEDIREINELILQNKEKLDLYILLHNIQT